MNRRLMMFLGVASAALSLSCFWNHLDPDPPRPCDPAFECARITGTPRALCNSGPFNNSDFWVLENRHPNRTIVVAYTQTIDHLNQPGVPPESSTKQRFLGAGAAFDLGCRYVRVPNVEVGYDSYTWAVVSVCFIDDPNCEYKEIATGPAAAKCDQQCTGPDCVRVASDPVTAPALGEAERATRFFLRNNPPLDVDLNKLLALGSACPSRELMHVDAQNVFTDVGNSCWLRLMTPRSPSVDAVDITLTSRISGTVQPGVNRKTIVPERGQRQIMLNWIDHTGASLGTEQVDHVLATRQQLRIAGDRRFCIWIDLPSVQ